MTGLFLMASRAKCFASLCLIAAGTVGPAMAKQPGDNLPSGSFIVSRPITNSAAEGPRLPERPDYVVLGGERDVRAALDVGLQPISDEEQAAVLSGALPAIGVENSAMDHGVETLSDQRSISHDSLAQHQSGGVSGALRGAIGVLPSALGAMRSALGAGSAGQ